MASVGKGAQAHKLPLLFQTYINEIGMFTHILKNSCTEVKTISYIYKNTKLLIGLTQVIFCLRLTVLDLIILRFLFFLMLFYTSA